MVVFTTNYNRQIEEPRCLLKVEPIELGLGDYVRNKLGTKANNVSKIKNLFETSINPVCRSVTCRFATNDMLAEVVKNREDLRRDSNKISFNCSTAIHFRKIEKNHKESINEQGNKKISCLGKLFNKQAQ